MPILALDPILFIGAAIAYAIFQAFAKKRKDAQEWDEMERPALPIPRRPPARPAPRAKPAPPVILKQDEYVTIPSPQPLPVIAPRRTSPRELARMEQSQTAYQRAAALQHAVENRMAAIDQQTAAHKPAVPDNYHQTAESLRLLQSFRKPETIRQALLASFVFNPPKALE